MASLKITFVIFAIMFVCCLASPLPAPAPGYLGYGGYGGYGGIGLGYGGYGGGFGGLGYGGLGGYYW